MSIQLPLEIIERIFSFVQDRKTFESLKEIGPTSKYLAEKFCCSWVQKVQLSLVHEVTQFQPKANLILNSDEPDRMEYEDVLQWFKTVIQNAKSIKSLTLLLPGFLNENFFDWRRQKEDCFDVEQVFKPFLEKTFPSVVSLGVHGEKWDTLSMATIDKVLARTVANCPNLESLSLVNFDLDFHFNRYRDEYEEDFDESKVNPKNWPKNIQQMELWRAISKLPHIQTLKLCSGLSGMKFALDIDWDNSSAYTYMYGAIFVNELLQCGRLIIAAQMERFGKIVDKLFIDGRDVGSNLEYYTQWYKWNAFPEGLKEVHFSLSCFPPYSLNFESEDFQECIEEYFHRFQHKRRDLTVNFRYQVPHQTIEQFLESRKNREYTDEVMIYEFNSAPADFETSDFFDESTMLRPISLEMLASEEGIKGIWVVKKGKATVSVNLKVEFGKSDA